jgi:hypothetical protein
VNRLRPVLDDLISPYQSVFIPGRLIIDNALIAFECIHSLQQVKRLDRHFCDYKLDLSIRCHVETGLSPKMGGMGDELCHLCPLYRQLQCGPLGSIPAYMRSSAR